MKPLLFAFLWIVAFCAAAPVSIIAGDAEIPQKHSGVDAPRVRYEVALIDKSMTGGWQGERAFGRYVEELLGVSKIHRFKLRGNPLQDWLIDNSPSAVKIVCLIDGFTSSRIKRVDVRGSNKGKKLKATFEVKEENWKAALRRAKRYVEASR